MAGESATTKKTKVIVVGGPESLQRYDISLEQPNYKLCFETDIHSLANAVKSGDVAVVVVDPGYELPGSTVSELLDICRGANPETYILALVRTKRERSKTMKEYPQFTSCCTPNRGLKLTLDHLVGLYLSEELPIPSKNGNGSKYNTGPFSLTVCGTGGVGKEVARLTLIEMPGLEQILLYNRHPQKALSVKEDIARSLDAKTRELADKLVVIENLDKGLESDFLVVAVSNPYDPRELPSENRRHHMLKRDIECFVNVADATRGYNGVFLVFSNPIEVVAKMLREAGGNWKKIMGISPDSDRFKELLLRHYEARYRGLVRKTVEGTKLEVEGAIVIGEHGGTMVPLYSQVIFLHQYEKGGKVVERAMPFNRSKTSLKNMKSQITLALRNFGDKVYVEGGEPRYESGRVLVNELARILNQGITFGSVSYLFGKGEQRVPVYVQLPARWGIDSKHGIYIKEVKTPSRIPTLAPQSYRKPLTDSEWTNFVKSCRT
ncbi:hypothetical protein KY318_03835, partial [Candidatus Woesearchaeota archaeon]|nr:hypothetical protein [Candidatus Woesearchaeota archaeon]